LATAAELLALGVSKGRLRQWARDRQVTAVARGVYSPTAWLTDMADDPRIHFDRPYPVCYHVTVGAAPYTCDVFAYFAASPDGGQPAAPAAS
jgi:hypothetical protein